MIQNALDFLGFKHDELILSGLSMGSFGALYYAAQLEPAAVVVETVIKYWDYSR